MGEVPEEVDIAVIGGGVGCYTAAIRAAELGKSVVLIEKEKLGGHCLNYACPFEHVYPVLLAKECNSVFQLRRNSDAPFKHLFLRLLLLFLR